VNHTFIGVDLGWYGKPSGLASLTWHGSELHLGKIGRLQPLDEILDWIRAESGGGSCVVAIDAPTVIRNLTGIRSAERELNADFRRFHAGCHAANLGRPFAAHVLAFSRRLEQMGFLHGASLQPKQEGRFQIEVHPHAATVSLFGLERIVKYKRGRRDARAKELRRLRSLMIRHLPEKDPAVILKLPGIPKTGNLKPVEDRIDAVMCAYIAAHWWHWATSRNRLYGSAEDGYIVVPEPVSFQSVMTRTSRS
jgi:predicted RNase H-like nuclease